MSSDPLVTLRQAFERCSTMDASLGERLQAYSNAVREFIPDYANAVDDLVTRLRERGAGDNAPQPGSPMPPFLLPDETGRLVALEDLLRLGPAAITFQRGHWCPWCRISLAALSNAQADIGRIGAQVAAIVPETQRYAVEFKSRAQSPFPILTDLDNGYALSLNLAIWIGTELKKLLSSYGLSLPDYQDNEAWMLPIPATFVVGRDGEVKARFIDPDFRKRASIEDLTQALKSAAAV
jgi:peroxiredoxin